MGRNPSVGIRKCMLMPISPDVGGIPVTEDEGGFFRHHMHHLLVGLS